MTFATTCLQNGIIHETGQKTVIWLRYSKHHVYDEQIIKIYILMTVNVVYTHQKKFFTI